MISADRINEIREAFEDTKPKERNPEDIAIGELLDVLDCFVKEIEELLKALADLKFDIAMDATQPEDV